MRRREFLQLAGLGVTLSAANAWARAEEPDQQQWLVDLVHAVREKYKLPGMAAAIIGEEGLVAAAVSGVRHVDKPDLITLDDRFLIASCTKTMSQLTIARVVDAGKLTFQTTIGEVLPEMEMRDVYRDVTLGQLLTFQGGIQPYMNFLSSEAERLFASFKGTVAEQRRAFVRHVLSEEPVATPGSGRNYSNASYAIAALLATTRTGRDWESLVTEHVFRPLGMTRAGFGRPSNAQHPNEPWLHTNGTGPGLADEPPGKKAGPKKTGGPKTTGPGLLRRKQPAPVSNEPYRPQPEDMQERVALAAAGGVHCSIGDFAKFVHYELQTLTGKDPLLTPATAAEMREKLGISRREGVGIRGGSTYVSAGYILWPSRKLAAAAMVNAGGAAQACTDIFNAVDDA
jgi:CubicO group peptidase (beta-lactamase class C family)